MLKNCIVVTVIVKHTGDPFRVVDEGVAVTLECPDDIVSASLAFIDRVLQVPLQEGG